MGENNFVMNVRGHHIQMQDGALEIDTVEFEDDPNDQLIHNLVREIWALRQDVAAMPANSRGTEE